MKQFYTMMHGRKNIKLQCKHVSQKIEDIVSSQVNGGSIANPSINSNVCDKVNVVTIVDKGIINLYK